MPQAKVQTGEGLTHDDFIAQAQSLVPLLREKVREAEVARRPLDEVIDAVRATDIFSLMVPKRYGGHEADIDTFFEVSLTLSRADASMGWLIGFYIEHAFWFCHFPQNVQDEIFGDANHILAPAALNLAGGFAKKVEGGYQLSGQWAWGTGIIHSTWVMAGSLMTNEDGSISPMFFILPREDVEAVDTWHIAGMCGTGSWDFKIDNKFIPEERARPFLDLVTLNSGIMDRYDAPIYTTPMMVLLSFAAAAPCLGAAQGALAAYQEQIKAKVGTPGFAIDNAKLTLIAEAALMIEGAELMLRDVLREVMEQRNNASVETRSKWATRISHSVFQCRDAVAKIGASAGASGHFLNNPIQRSMRDINTASCHVVFNRESRYSDFGQLLFDQPIKNVVV
mgnify:CR=1 FL=1|tara:strand:+ start:22413 stop:23594 length:1182 start_codon:yes stop_codon:yes gene_type:complete